MHIAPIDLEWNAEQEKVIVEAEHAVPTPIRMACHSVCGSIASALVSPFVGIIDGAVVKNAAGKGTLIQGLRTGLTDFLSTPLRFIRQPTFYWTWGVFSGTYIVANTMDTICGHYSLQSSDSLKFYFTAAANVVLNLLRDKALTQYISGKVLKIPAASYLCFGARDASTMVSSFVFPQLISKSLEQQGLSHPVASTIAQLFVPCVAQVISTPMHLYGLDRLNHPNISVKEHLMRIKQSYLKTFLFRCMRIFPAFGIGGVCNRLLIAKTDEYLVDVMHNKNISEIKCQRQLFNEKFPKGMNLEAFARHTNAKSLEEARLTFRVIDANGDGVIDVKEFVAYNSLALSGSPEEHLDYQFRAFDIDNSGTICIDDLQEVLEFQLKFGSISEEALKKTYGERTSTKEVAKKMLDFCDKNLSNDLCKDEFPCLVHEFRTLQNMKLT